MLKLAGKTQGAVISCNVSWKESIDAPTLVGVLSGALPLEPWQFHLDTFFNELPHDNILGVMRENDLSIKQLAKIFYSLHPVLQGKNFKALLESFDEKQ
jgi:hypothetical protein